jgi:hypothetical protein
LTSIPTRSPRPYASDRPSSRRPEANALAWQLGAQQLERANHEVRIWYVGLRDVQMHLARVTARVKDGGHDIPIKHLDTDF